jgi:hypothetical protein
MPGIHRAAEVMIELVPRWRSNMMVYVYLDEGKRLIVGQCVDRDDAEKHLKNAEHVSSLNPSHLKIIPNAARADVLAKMFGSV